MLNTTKEIIFRIGGEKLDFAIREALQKTAEEMMAATAFTTADLEQVTSKTKREGAFPKFVLQETLKSNVAFDEGYVRYAYDCAKNLSRSTFLKNAFDAFARLTPLSVIQSTDTLAAHAFPGLGLMLIRLHAKKAITLPAKFDWPVNRNNAYDIASLRLSQPSELLAFVRSLVMPKEEGSARSSDGAFGRIAEDRRRAEWFGTRGTKVLLALGWHEPEDINLEDCTALNEAFAKIGAKSLSGTMFALLQSLKAKFGPRAKIDGTAWQYDKKNRLEQARPSRYLVSTTVEKEDGQDCFSDSNDAFRRLVETDPSEGNVDLVSERIKRGIHPYSSKYDLSAWMDLEQLYFNSERFESVQSRKNLMGVLNLYLCYYLPAWFEDNVETELTFPSTPNSLVSAVYVTRLLRPKMAVPQTLMEFVRERAEHRRLVNTTQYQIVSGISLFFEFIANQKEELPNCGNFRNPLTKRDFPPSGRSGQTNKRPFPRAFFSTFVSYVSAVKTYVDVLVDRSLDGTFQGRECEDLKGELNVVDTFATAARVGFIPVLFVENRTVPIRYLVYTPTLSWYRMASTGLHLLLPCPHAINQILVALYTGIRHNHIQWLDVRTFDQRVNADEEESDYVPLYVNTDKVKEEGWYPEVNRAVISVLRSQRQWRELIGSDGFKTLCHYNKNKKTKYDPILPLFAYGEDGTPHNDNQYNDAWYDLLMGFQGLVSHLFPGKSKTRKSLLKLLPPGFLYNDPNERALLREYRPPSGKKKKPIEFYELRVKSDITPHSARVSVVTHTLTFLSADLIGSKITGQSTATVYHYYRPDPEDQRENVVHQGMHMRDLALQRQAFKKITGKEPDGRTSIQADVNSALARTMDADLEGAIVDYGLVSLMMRQGDRPGVDILRERGVRNVAFNKTELCPYDNTCPDFVVRLLKGIRRCSLCPCAVRSIDHLPAIVAKKKSVLEILADIDRKLDSTDENSAYSEEDLDLLEDDRQRVAEEAAGWEASEQILEVQRSRIAAGSDTRTWVVEKPEIIAQDLQRIETPNNGTTYLLTRLAECISYPGYQSPRIRGMIDVARRRILLSNGEVSKALSMEVPIDPASECAGLIRSLVEANGLTMDDVIGVLGTDAHLRTLPSPVVLGVQYESE